MADESKVLQAVIGIFAFIAIICGGGIFAWQIYVWLKLGYWTSIPLSEGLQYVGFDLSSVYYPSDWVGVMKIIQWLLKWPLSFCLPFITVPIIIIPAYILISIGTDIKDYIRKK